MLTRIRSGLLIVTVVLLTPAVGACQDIPPASFEGAKFSHPTYDIGYFGRFCKNGRGVIGAFPLYETAEWRAGAYVSWWGPDAAAPLATLALDRYLATTAIGGWSVSAEGELTASSAGPIVSLNWYPWESVSLSLRWNLLRGVTPIVHFDFSD